MTVVFILSLSILLADQALFSMKDTDVFAEVPKRERKEKMNRRWTVRSIIKNERLWETDDEQGRAREKRKEKKREGLQLN